MHVLDCILWSTNPSSVFCFQNYNNMEFGIVRLIGIFVVGEYEAKVTL